MVTLTVTSWNLISSWLQGLDDLGVDEKARGITDQHVTIGTPSRVEVNGHSAYVIASAVYAFKEKGVPTR